MSNLFQLKIICFDVWAQIYQLADSLESLMLRSSLFSLQRSSFIDVQFESKKIFGLKKIAGLKKISVRKNIGPLRKFGFKINFGPQDILSLKISLVRKKVWPQKWFWAWTKFWSLVLVVLVKWVLWTPNPRNSTKSPCVVFVSNFRLLIHSLLIDFGGGSSSCCYSCCSCCCCDRGRTKSNLIVACIMLPMFRILVSVITS